MKISKSITTLLCGTLIVFGLTSCAKDDDTLTPDKLTDEEVVELVEASLQKSTGGLNQTTAMYSEELTTNITLNELCGSLYQETFPYSINDAYIQAEYIFDGSYQINCTSLNIPETVELNVVTTGTYSTRRIESNDVSQTSFTISGLEFASDAYLFNGNFIKEGNQQITMNQKTRSVYSAVYVELTNLAVDKVNYQIISGNATLTLTGNTNQINSFSFEGTIIFNGNRTATLTLSGNAYEINLD
jgi:hypothetical protein